MLSELVTSEVLECGDREKSVRRLGRGHDGGMVLISGKSHKETKMGAGHQYNL